MKKYFVLKLIPCRPSFSHDMNAEERAIMLQHVAYWKEKMAQGFVLVFGPVMDPKGVYGLGIVEAENAEQVNSFIENDPASKINTYEFFQMMAIVPEK
jgi:uncharacterized protein YciI